MIKYQIVVYDEDDVAVYDRVFVDAQEVADSPIHEDILIRIEEHERSALV